jgi:hypothetical protein
MEFSVAFLNCHDLFQPGVRPGRGPADAVALEVRLTNLAATLAAAVTVRPGLVGLCEVGDSALGANLGERLEPGRYGSVWSGLTGSGTGLQVLYDQQLFEAGAPHVEEGARAPRARIRWMAVPVKLLVRSRGPLWFAVHHWRSDRHADRAEEVRDTSWRSFSDFHHSGAALHSDALIVAGDFNCEPGDHPLVRRTERILEGARERELVRRGLRGGSLLYNPMWRFMGEEVPFEDSIVAGYERQRPLGTWREPGGPWRLVDQMLVTRALLWGPFFQFIEGTLRITHPIGGCSPHSALGATFRILET